MKELLWLPHYWEIQVLKLLLQLQPSLLHIIHQFKLPLRLLLQSQLQFPSLLLLQLLFLKLWLLQLLLNLLCH